MGERGVNASCPQARLLCRPAVICRGGSAATGRLRFWELLGIFWEFLREARSCTARFWLRLSAQQHPHLNRTRKSQLALSNTTAPSAHLNRLSKSQLPSAITGKPQHTSENISKFPKISQDLPKSPTQFLLSFSSLWFAFSSSFLLRHLRSKTFFPKLRFAASASIAPDESPL